MSLFVACMMFIASSTVVPSVDTVTATATYTGNVEWTNIPGHYGQCYITLYGPRNEILGSDIVSIPGDEYDICYSFAGNPPNNCHIRALLKIPSLEFQYRYEYDIDYPEDYSGYTHSHNFDFNTTGLGLENTSGSDGLSLVNTTFADIKSYYGQ